MARATSIGFVMIFVFGANIIGVIGRVDHQAELSFALLLMAVDADIDRAGAALFANHRRRVDVGAGVALVDGENGQKIEVGGVAFENHFLARRVLGGDFLDRHRVVLAMRQIFHHLRHRGRAQGQCQPFVGGAEIDDQRNLRAFDVLEKYQGKFVFAFELLDDAAGFVRGSTSLSTTTTSLGRFSSSSSK